jgi:hypothetical protein
MKGSSKLPDTAAPAAALRIAVIQPALPAYRIPLC